MGKKEQLAELDRQLAEVEKTKKWVPASWLLAGLFAFIALLFPLFWIFALLIAIFAIIDSYRTSRRMNELNLEKAKLK